MGGRGRMGRRQSDRQLARRAALDAQARMRAERSEQDKRRSALGVLVAEALAERNVTTAACERRAGEAIRAMIEDEGLNLASAVSWCGGVVTTREAARLRRLAQSPTVGDRAET